jgi:hypothetical protein
VVHGAGAVALGPASLNAVAMPWVHSALVTNRTARSSALELSRSSTMISTRFA